MLSLPTLGTVSAQKDKLNIKGEVLSVEVKILTVESNKGVTVEVMLSPDLTWPDLQVGDSVLIKAVAGEGDEWIAETVKVLGQGANDDLDESGGFRNNSAYCAEDKKTSPHPLAPKIAERYGVSEAMVMTYYCEGYSIGQIMLAIKTSQIEGVNATPEEILNNLDSGNAWGLIWKDLGLIGWEKNGNSPPGQLKKLNPNQSDGDD
jgi:hypothetical protein